MNKSVTVIFVFGVLGFSAMLLMMTIGLDGMTGGTAGERIKLAQEIQEAFNLETIGITAKKEGDRRILHIVYSTRQETDFSTRLQHAEIKRIAVFAGEIYDEEDRKKIDEFHIIRTEVRDRGCWTGTDVTEATHPNPHREIEIEGEVPEDPPSDESDPR